MFYRISDSFQKTTLGEASNKERPQWFDKRASFENLLNTFGARYLFVVADCVGDKTKRWLESKISISHNVSYFRLS